MKRDIKKILGSADAEKIAEDYKAVDTKTSQRMFSNYLKKVGTANNQFSETTENSEIYKVEKANNTNIVRRISAFTAYAAAFVLLIGATVGIIKMKGPKTIKSFTAALVALGCVVSRPATDAVKKGSQIADRFTINRFSGKQKRPRF